MCLFFAQTEPHIVTIHYQRHLLYTQHKPRRQAGVRNHKKRNAHTLTLQSKSKQDASSPHPSDCALFPTLHLTRLFLDQWYRYLHSARPRILRLVLIRWCTKAEQRTITTPWGDLSSLALKPRLTYFSTTQRDGDCLLARHNLACVRAGSSRPVCLKKKSVGIRERGLQMHIQENQYRS